MIAAMAANRIIGADNDMPWHLPADLRHFKSVTMGKPVVMGRKTYESIGKALPGRPNIVITRQDDFLPDDAHITNSVDDALKLAERLSDATDEIMIIGGGSIYSALLDRADKLYLTFIDANVEGDTQFPDYTRLQWKETASEAHTPDEKNSYNYRFVTLERA
ncbi:type 3 dihydrofolate reductase [Salinimonas sp. HHU 13199]|uniref:Dihydrofolate reductase n=1 Tax=Salinimonas profundi TaxID=2729140 RepID=A0ABR8LL82_9ALTE|nr:type 3 dihydrofolate reductase [Salinimonas profundi]